jgi:hypothetical protein
LASLPGIDLSQFFFRPETAIGSSAAGILKSDRDDPAFRPGIFAAFGKPASGRRFL